VVNKQHTIVACSTMGDHNKLQTAIAYKYRNGNNRNKSRTLWEKVTTQG